jgi:hypothetical protein
MNDTPKWAVLSKNVLLLLQMKRLGFELRNGNTVLELHMTPDRSDHFPAAYQLNNQVILKLDLSQLDKALTVRMQRNFHLLTDCLVLTEPSGHKILRVGSHYGYFQSEALMVQFLCRLQHELNFRLPNFNESKANHFFTTYDRIIAGFFICSAIKCQNSSEAETNPLQRHSKQTNEP